MYATVSYISLDLLYIHNGDEPSENYTIINTEDEKKRKERKGKERKGKERKANCLLQFVYYKCNKHQCGTNDGHPL